MCMWYLQAVMSLMHYNIQAAISTFICKSISFNKFVEVKRSNIKNKAAYCIGHQSCKTCCSCINTNSLQQVLLL